MKLKLTKNQFKIIVESIKKDQLKEFNLGGFSIFSLSPQLGMVKSLIDLFNGGSLTPDELKSELKKVKEKKDEPEKKPKIDQIVPRPVKVKQKPIQEPKVIKKPTQDVKPPDNILIGDFHVYYISIESDFFRLIGSDPSEKSLWIVGPNACEEIWKFPGTLLTKKVPYNLQPSLSFIAFFTSS